MEEEREGGRRRGIVLIITIKQMLLVISSKAIDISAFFFIENEKVRIQPGNEGGGRPGD
uniref:Uncharacterized protein n=1 Tax=Oryza sativa subsp. japonica TaxID=39947 RepID=Q10T21_ORYSJ|nr:hypothetical protein LOC_Os03g01350 [Oryza sativa Japonica Group]